MDSKNCRSCLDNRKFTELNVIYQKKIRHSYFQDTKMAKHR